MLTMCVEVKVGFEQLKGATNAHLMREEILGACLYKLITRVTGSFGGNNWTLLIPGPRPGLSHKIG